jgi:hypothetical protein
MAALTMQTVSRQRQKGTTKAVSTPQVTRECSKMNVIDEKKLTNVVVYSLSSVQRMITDPKLYVPKST